jgi:LysR family transcriptional regulator (chromosome initiation inhibitor)
MLAPALRDKRIVIIDRRRWLDVPLYWQHAAVRSNVLQHIGQALRAAASDMQRDRKSA